MLSTKDNELLTRIVGEAPIGQMIRRYWIPVYLSTEVAEPDGAPVRVKLLGKRLVVFRDTARRVGVTDERCPHRLASLTLGRKRRRRPVLHLTPGVFATISAWLSQNGIVTSSPLNQDSNPPRT